MDRILAEWRQAEFRLDDEPWNAEQEARVEHLRHEYGEALRARLAEAEELAKPPRLLTRQ